MESIIAKIASKKRNIYSLLASILISACLSVGSCICRNSSIVCLSTFLSFVIYLLSLYFVFSKWIFASNKTKSHCKIRPFSIKKFLLFFSVIFVLWLPVFLAYFPGIFGYDVDMQLWNNTATTHHPLLHTMYLNGVYLIGKTIGLSDTKIGAMITLSQMLIMAIVYALVSENVRQVRSNKAAWFIALFFAIFPASSFGAISITKDALYSAFFVLLVSTIWQISIRKRTTKKDYVYLGVILLLFSLLRNNAPYIIAAWLIIALLVWIKIKRFGRIILTGAIVLVLSLVVNHLLISSTGAVPYQEQAAFAVPLQQMLGVAKKYDNEVPQKGVNGKIFGLFERDELPDDLEFIEFNADIAKQTIGKQITKENKKEFIIAYIKTGLKYPLDYIRIFARLTLSSWYPFSYDYAVFYGTQFAETRTPRYSALLPNIQQDSKLPRLKLFLDNHLKELGYKNNFVLEFLMAPATYVYILIVTLLVAMYRKKRVAWLPILMVICCYLCTLLSPGILLRFMWPIMFTVPLLVIMVFGKNKNYNTLPNRHK